MAKKTTTVIKGRDLKRGDYLLLDDGSLSKIESIVRAPIRVKNEDGTVEVPRWAYLANGGHATVCREDHYHGVKS